MTDREERRGQVALSTVTTSALLLAGSYLLVAHVDHDRARQVTAPSLEVVAHVPVVAAPVAGLAPAPPPRRRVVVVRRSRPS